MRLWPLNFLLDKHFGFAYITHMDINQRRTEAAQLLAAIEWLRAHVDCNGPLGHLPTSDSGVRMLCAAIRHLTTQRRKVQ